MTLSPARTQPARRRSAIALCLVLTGLASVPAALGAQAPAPPLTHEQAELQGIWVLESMEIDGRKAVEDQTRGWILVIKGDQYNPGSGQTSVEYTFKIDPTLNPRSIDLIPHDGPYKGRTIRGVYSCKGEKLTLCRARTPDGERPAGFTTRPDSGLVSTVWKRRKP